MHKISIPQSVIDEVVKHRGREHVFDDLDPKKTALVVVDMQNGFMMPGVAHALCTEAVNVVPNINRIAVAVRKTGGTVIWIKNTATAETRQSWSVKADMDGPEKTAERADAMAPGSKGHELWAGLDVQPEDLTVQKMRFSAFIQGSSNLEALLRGKGIDTVLITGTVTNVCCESTARDAMMMNYKTIFAADGTATFNDEEHNATLGIMLAMFADVMTTDEIVVRLSQNLSQAAE